MNFSVTVPMHSNFLTRISYGTQLRINEVGCAFRFSLTDFEKNEVAYSIAFVWAFRFPDADLCMDCVSHGTHCASGQLGIS